MTILTYNTRLIFANETEKSHLIEVLEAERKAFNYCSAKHFGSKKNSIVDLHAKCYNDIRQQWPEIKSQIIVRAENSCLSAYRSIKSNKQKIDKPPVKKKLAMRLDKRLYSYKDGVFRLTTLDKRIACKPYLFPKLVDLLSSCKFSDPLIFVRDGDIWISLSFKVESTAGKQNLVLGVDLGVRRFAATSDGQLFIDKAFNKRKRELRYLKRMLHSKADTGSKTAKKHLKRLRTKEQNINKNFNFHLANKILYTKANIIAVENLVVKKMKAKKHKFQNKNRISQVSFAELRRILTYKAELVGKQVVCVNPRYTSQVDPFTGEMDGQRVGCRYYAKSGLVYDADILAAYNIAKRTQLPALYSNILDGQGTVTNPLR